MQNNPSYNNQNNHINLTILLKKIEDCHYFISNVQENIYSINKIKEHYKDYQIRFINTQYNQSPTNLTQMSESSKLIKKKQISSHFTLNILASIIDNLHPLNTIHNRDLLNNQANELIHHFYLAKKHALLSSDSSSKVILYSMTETIILQHLLEDFEIKQMNTSLWEEIFISI